MGKGAEMIDRTTPAGDDEEIEILRTTDCGGFERREICSTGGAGIAPKRHNEIRIHEALRRLPPAQYRMQLIENNSTLQLPKQTGN